MGHSAKVIADSVSEAGARLTTIEVRFPRIVLAELNTHSALSKNGQSSRAIPLRRTIEAVRDDPYVPDEWPANGPGMSPQSVLGGEDAERARQVWLDAWESALRHAREMAAIGLHKEIANRVLEPYMWHTGIVTATTSAKGWSNFVNLRCAPSASRPIRLLAERMRDALAESTPRLLRAGEWHLPYIRPEDRATLPPEDLIPVSAGRCARVSYLTHAGTRDPSEDLRLARDLLRAGHMSPWEHQATPLPTADAPSGNLRGWLQYRKTIPGEEDVLGSRA